MDKPHSKFLVMDCFKIMAIHQITLAYCFYKIASTDLTSKPDKISGNCLQTAATKLDAL